MRGARAGRVASRRLATLEAPPWPHEGLPIEAARHPPPAWCADPRLFDAERAALVHATWQPVCPADDVALPDSAAAACVAGAPLLLARAAADGRLRSFHNVCRHAGATLHPGESSGGPAAGGRLVCRQHGWSYALDGRLATAPRMGGAAGFRAREYGLAPAGGAAVWGPVAFGRVRGGRAGEPDPPPVAPEVVTAALAAAGLPMTTADYTVVARRRFVVGANWKVVAANYLDGGHHVPRAHPALAASLAMDTYESVVFDGGHSLQSAAAAAGAGGRVAGGAPGPARAMYAFLFPCLMLNAYGPWLDANFLRPLAVDRTAVDYIWWLKKGARLDAAAVAAALDDSATVQEEDNVLCASVQAGLGSPGAAPGVYAPRVETPLHAFHVAVAAAYRAGGLLA